jgi:hypothetical protein
MRTIKYRIQGNKDYEPTANKTYYGTNDLEQVLNNDNSISNLAGFERHIQGNRYDASTRCLYTGVKDKNNQEIYENDTLKIQYEDGFYLTKVLWDNGALTIEVQGQDYERTVLQWAIDLELVQDIEIVNESK